MSQVQLYAFVGWLAIAAMTLIYVLASVSTRQMRVGVLVYMTLAAVAMATVGLRFAEAW